MGAAKASAVSELEQAFEVFNRVSHELDTSYRDLESKVAGLTGELAAARSGRLQELAEKERLANRLSSLVAALPGGVLIVDSSGQIRDVNPEAIGLLGEPLIGESWDSVVARTALLERRQAATELHLRSGKVISVVSRSLDTSGDHVVLITDVTEMHKLQEQLGRKKRLTALGEMAARLAHQVRTPLSSATLYLSQLNRRDMSDEQRLSVAGKISERLGHMSSLVDGMLGFVRGSAPVSELVYIADALQSFEMSMQPQLERYGATLAVPPVDRTLAVVGDQDELAGVLCNIAMNAVEVCDAPAELQVWVGALNADWLQLRIIDNGPGIAQDVIERIFDPFFTTRAKGTGLGLAVVDVTVANYGGEVTVQNRAQGGAEFIINLPIAHELLAPGSAGEAAMEAIAHE
tara:strand:- start:10556 stop:11770 length:1215 start_codon:yes stop_codon:yes gene_type:complete